MSGVEDVVAALGKCISEAQSSVNGAMSVAFMNEDARKSLKEIIIDAIQKRKDPLESSADKINKNTKNIGNALDKQSRKFEEAFKNFSRNLDSWEKISDKWHSLLSNIPAFGNILNGLYTLVEGMINLQLKSVKNYQQLNNAGIALENSTTALYGYASEIGISIDVLTKNMIDYSQELAKMRGIFGNGLVSFVQLEKNVKGASKEIGMNFPTAIKATMNYFNSMADSYFVQNRSMEELQTESERYIKTLQKLSIVSGKSADSILSEIEAREKNIKWQMISSDEKNKEMITAMTAMGFSQDDIISVITGMMQETTAKTMVNPGSAAIINSLMQIQRSGQRLTGEEILKYSQNAYKASGANRYAMNDYLFYKNNPHLAYTMDEDVVRGVIIPQRIMEMSDIESNRIDNEKNKGVVTIYEEVAKGFNKFLNAFSIQGESFNNTIAGIIKALNYFNENVFTKERSEKIRNWIDNTLDNFVKKIVDIVDSMSDITSYIKETFQFIKNHWQIMFGILLALKIGGMRNGSGILTGNLGTLSSIGITGYHAYNSYDKFKNGDAIGGLGEGARSIGVGAAGALGRILGGEKGAMIGTALAEGAVEITSALTKGFIGLFTNSKDMTPQERFDESRKKLIEKYGQDFVNTNDKNWKDKKELLDDHYSKISNTTLKVKNEDENKYEDEKKDILISIRNDINSMKTNMSSLLASSRSIDNNTNNVNQKLGNISFTREVEYQSV